MHAYIGLGANLGAPLATFTRATRALEHLGQVQRGSPLYQTDPVVQAGGPPQPDYLNAAVLLASPLDPPGLLAALLGIEAALGRVRGPADERDSPRPIDLDILLLGERGQLVWHSEGLDVPHGRLHQRLFALVPLLDINPDLRHPELGLPLRDLSRDLHRSQRAPLRLEGAPPWRTA